MRRWDILYQKHNNWTKLEHLFQFKWVYLEGPYLLWKALRQAWAPPISPNLFSSRPLKCLSNSINRLVRSWNKQKDKITYQLSCCTTPLPVIQVQNYLIQFYYMSPLHLKFGTQLLSIPEVPILAVRSLLHNALNIYFPRQNWNINC